MSPSAKVIRNKIEYCIQNNIPFKLQVEDQYIENILYIKQPDNSYKIQAVIQDNILYVMFPRYYVAGQNNHPGCYNTVAIINFEQISSIITIDKITNTVIDNSDGDCIAKIKTILDAIVSMSTTDYILKLDDSDICETIGDHDYNDPNLGLVQTIFFSYEQTGNTYMNALRWIAFPYEAVQIILVREDVYIQLAETLSVPSLGEKMGA